MVIFTYSNLFSSSWKMPHQPPLVSSMDTPHGFVPPLSHQVMQLLPFLNYVEMCLRLLSWT